jgi:hypothetical protein
MSYIEGIPDEYLIVGGAGVLLITMINDKVRKELKEMHPEWTDEEVETEIRRQWDEQK